MSDTTILGILNRQESYIKHQLRKGAEKGRKRSLRAILKAVQKSRENIVEGNMR